MISISKLKYLTNFDITLQLIFLSLFSEGLGNYLFGITLFTNVSTLIVYLILIHQLYTRTIFISKKLMFLLLVIFAHTFIFNYYSISFLSSIKQFIGLAIFSTSIFGFVNYYKNRLLDILKGYYNFVFIATLIVIIQDIFFVFLGISIVPQNIISGYLLALHSNSFTPEILGFLPRGISLWTEPAHFAVIVLPGVYLALLVMSNKSKDFKLIDKKKAIVILLGFVLSFSLVGYIGLLLSIIAIFFKNIRKSLFTNFIFISLFLLLFYFIIGTSVGSKVTSLINIQNDVQGYEYTSSDLTGFAIVSNILIMKESLTKSYFLGSGINSHKEIYSKYIYNYFSEAQVILELNKDDASSLFIRLTSEFGIPGIFLFLYFLVKFRIRKIQNNNLIKSINTLSLVIIFSYSIRNGNYLSVYCILFLSIYYTSFKNNSLFIKNTTS